jgi:Rho termination factor, N-terminal domain/Pentapeptide repeats (8 copies)/NACHT domain
MVDDRVPGSPGFSSGGSTKGRRDGRGLSSLLMPELQRIAQTMAIPGAGRMRKGQLIEAIEARQGGAPRQGTGTTKHVPDVLDPGSEQSEREGAQSVLDHLYDIDQQFVADSIIALRRGAQQMLGHSARNLDLFGPENIEQLSDQWDVLQNYAEMAFPDKRVNRTIIDASYDPTWRQALSEWAQQNADLLGEDALGSTAAFEHAADLDFESYVDDFAESSPALDAALAAGRLPCTPALVQRSRKLAVLATSIWRVTSADSPMLHLLLDVDELPEEHGLSDDEPFPTPQNTAEPTAPTRPRSRPQVEGARLETSVFDIFKHLFRFDDNEIQRLKIELRRQQSGTQFGTDIIFRASAIDSSSTCLVECKNYASDAYSGLPVSVVADKVLQAEAAFDTEPVDHWILISPHVDPNNELDRLVQRWNVKGTFPFTVQIWSPQTGVRDLFAIVPRIYKGLYGEDAPKLQDPDGILAVFSARLLPPIRLPGKLGKYVRDTRSFVEPNESAWLDQLDSQIERFGFDEKGARLQGSLEDEVLSVLFDSPNGSNIVLLLAEFGEGKSFFTVSLCVRLQARYLREPRSASPIPVRFFLRGYRNVSAPLDFLRDQLGLIGLGMEEWAELRRRNVLIILDGLDEMSVQQDSATTRSNLDKIGSLLEELDGLPVLVTSRPHFFSSGPDRERFYDRLRRPHVFCMGQPDRSDTVVHLRAYAQTLGLAPKLNKIKELYDPIGLAGKVLFLEMIKKTLPELPEDRFDELILYDTYVKGSLQRKVELLRDPSSASQDAELLKQLEELLEKIAIEIHVTGEGNVDLRKFVSKSGGAAQLLWKASQMHDLGADKDEDASARIGSRSLLRRVGFEPGQEEGSWLVDFFHRSMKEYFVAKALRRALNARDPFAETRGLLMRAPIQPEILGFFRLLARDDEDACTVLASLAHSARVSSGQGLLGGGAISLYYAAGGQMSGSDWRSLQLDGALLAGSDLSGSDLRNSTLRSADLTSSDLTRADLRYSDFSDANLNAGGSIIALSQDIASQRYLYLTQECGVGTIVVNSDDSLKFLHISLPRTLRWPENIYILAEDVVLIVGHAEFLIVAVGSGTAEEVAQFRVTSDLRSTTVIDQSLLGLVFEPESGTSEAILIDIRDGQVLWRTRVLPGGGAYAWSRHGITITYGSEVAVYRMDETDSTTLTDIIQSDMAISGRSLAFVRDNIIVTTDDGRVAWLRTGNSIEINKIQAHGGAGTAVVAANGDTLSAGSDGSVALVRQGKDLKLKITSRLERRLRCSGARIRGLQGVRERDIFLANGASSGAD